MKVDGNQVTLTGELSEYTPFNLPGQQTTVENHPPGNKQWSRAIQLTENVVMVMRHKAKTVALDIKTWAEKFAPILEPSLTWAPRITRQPAATPPTKDKPEVRLEVEATSEVSAQKYQWQVSEDGNNFTDCAGGNDSALVINSSPLAPGSLFYRCSVTNESGTSYSNATSIEIEEPEQLPAQGS